MSIHEAAEEGREEDLQRLIVRNIQAVNEEDEFGETPLHLACMAGHAGCVKVLLQNGANVDRPNSNGTTPLHYAARYGRQSCVALLLRSGANVSRKDNAHWTPLHYAAFNAQFKCSALLVEKGADPNALTSEQNSPLHLATSAGALDCVVLLIRHGAKLTIKNKENNTPLSLLPIKGRSDANKNVAKQLSDDLRGLVNQKTYADVAFIIEGDERKTIYGHKNIICLRCPRLKETIQQHERNNGSSSNGSSESEQIGHLTLAHVQGISAAVFENLLHYLYTAEVPAVANFANAYATATTDATKMRELVSVIELLRGADIYQCTDLITYCEDTLLANMTIKSAMDFLLLSDIRKKPSGPVNLAGVTLDDAGLRCLGRVRKICGEYIVEHFNEAAADYKTLRKLKKDTLVELLPDFAVEQKHKPAEYVRRVPTRVEKPDAMKGILLAECKKVLADLMKDKDAWPFNEPVDPVALGVPTYFDIIKEPMDFGTISQRLKKGKYEILSQFERDVQLVFSNALTFNEPDSEIPRRAKKLRGIFDRRQGKLHKIVKENKESSSAVATPSQPTYTGSQKEPASTSTSTSTSASAAKKRTATPANTTSANALAINPEEIEQARARLSQNVNRLNPQQLMEVFTMIQSSVQTGEEGDSNGDIEIDLNEIPPDILMKIQSYVDSCLAGSPNDGDNLDDMALETELQTTTTTPSAKSTSVARKRPRDEFDFETTPEELGGGLENNAKRNEKRERRRDGTERADDAKRKKRPSSTAAPGGALPRDGATSSASSIGAISAAVQQQQRKERKRVKEERDADYTPSGSGGGRAPGAVTYHGTPTSFEHIEFGHS